VSSGPFNVVDVFDVTTSNTWWTTATLSQSRRYLASTSLGGNLAFFGGEHTNENQPESKVVDIFNSTSQTWSNTTH
jgi:N-acetylneuraminic acid mutarotase